MAKTKNIRLTYYAALKELCGQSDETLTTAAPTARDLFEEIKSKYGLSLTTDSLRVSVNGTFLPWHTPIRDGDHVVFIPPVAGG